MDNPMSDNDALRSKKRGWRKIFASIVIVAITVFILLRLVSGNLFQKTESGNLRFVMPTVSQFRHEIAVRGDISSSENKDVKCDVRSSGGVMITWVIDEGTEVKEGDLIATLDKSALIDSLDAQVNKVAQSEAEVKAAENALTTAEIAKKEYEEGSYKVSLQKLVSTLIKAKEERDRLTEYLEHSTTLYEKGFITKSQLEADIFSLKQAESDLRTAELDIYVLKKFTHEKSSKNYDSDIETAKANLVAKQSVHLQNEAKLKDIKQQIEFCAIKSPGDGKILYVNETNRFGSSEFLVCQGAMVRERQVFLRLPNSTKLQVTADVHEGKISYIKVGQPVSVRTDATGERDIIGRVIKVNENPQPTNHWMGNVKEYRVTIELEGTPGVLPGMTAETKILVEETPDDVIMIPTHTVFEHGGKYYCITRNAVGKLEPMIVELGHSNDKMVIVTSDNVKMDTPLLSAAFENRDRIKLPELQTGQTSSPNIRPNIEVKMDNAPSASSCPSASQPGAGKFPENMPNMPAGMPKGMQGKMPPGPRPEGMPPRMPRGPRPGA